MMLSESLLDFLLPLESRRTNKDVKTGGTCFLLECPDGDVITVAPPTRQVALDTRTEYMEPAASQRFENSHAVLVLLSNEAQLK